MNDPEPTTFWKWRRSVEAEKGWSGVTFCMMVQSGTVISAEAWSGVDFLGSWSKPPPSNPNTPERNDE